MKPQLSACTQSQAHLRERHRQLMDDELGTEPQDLVAEPGEAAVTLGIDSGAPSVMSAIDLDDELVAGAHEVTDVASERDLTSKRDAQLAVDESRPEELLGQRGSCSHGGSVSGDSGLATSGNEAMAHESLPSPAERPGAATRAQAACQAPNSKGGPYQAWRGACAPGAARPLCWAQEASALAPSHRRRCAPSHRRKTRSQSSSLRA